MTTFSDLLTKYMRVLGLTEAELADKIGVSTDTIRHWRASAQYSRCKTVKKIAKTLQLTPEQQNEFFLAAGCVPNQSDENSPDLIVPIVDRPITHPCQFFGRDNLLERIRHAWREPLALEHVVVIGPRHSGKTSLLNYLQNVNQTPPSQLRPEQPQGWNDWRPNNFQFARIDFRDSALCQPEKLLREILHQLNLTEPTPCDFDHFVEVIKQLERPTVILMDEIGLGMKAPSRLDYVFWKNMRFLGSHSGKLGFLVTAHEVLEELVLNIGRDSSFFNVFGNFLEMGPLFKTEATALLNYFPYPVTPEDTLEILENSDCWPARLQKICHYWQFASEIGLKVGSTRLWKLPSVDLPKFKQFLETQDRLASYLRNMEVDETRLEEAIKFVTEMLNSERRAVLANRLDATATDETTISEPDVFKLNFGDNFPVDLNNCLLYFPAANLPPSEILLRLQKGEMTFQVTLVISLDSEQQKALRPLGEEPSTPSVVPNSRELMTLLLSPEPINAFVTLLASQLKITQISPYQLTGGVNKDILFFGRIQTIEHIMNREPANYLLMGGRQVGKSSVLKYIARRYQNHSKIDCRYLVLTSERLQPKLAQALGLGLPSKTDFETLLEELINVPNGQKRLLLIDEADLFIREEINNGYPILNEFRGLAEEGRCFFIFAGFWDLYEAVSLDNQSPLKNFGESITIGALEAEACRELVIKPMATLGIRYASDELVEQIVEKTGQRANLIAIACNEMLKQLDRQQRVLTQEDVTRALQSKTVQDALAGWRRLSEDEQAAGLDRFIVCATVKTGEFSLYDIMQVLDEHHYAYTAEQLNQSLARLELALIIQRDKDRYRYCVPLFRQMLVEQDVTALLKLELKSAPLNKSTTTQAGRNE
jgi:transcriptional regulator with XRE-family HTH domain